MFWYEALIILIYFHCRPRVAGFPRHFSLVLKVGSSSVLPFPQWESESWSRYLSSCECCLELSLAPQPPVCQHAREHLHDLCSTLLCFFHLGELACLGFGRTCTTAAVRCCGMTSPSDNTPIKSTTPIFQTNSQMFPDPPPCVGRCVPNYTRSPT